MEVEKYFASVKHTKKIKMTTPNLLMLIPLKTEGQFNFGLNNDLTDAKYKFDVPCIFQIDILVEEAADACVANCKYLKINLWEESTERFILKHCFQKLFGKTS